jgi:Recombination endonuclease VII
MLSPRHRGTNPKGNRLILCYTCGKRKPEIEMHIERGHTRHLCKCCRNKKRRAVARTKEGREKNRAACETFRTSIHPSGLTNGRVAELKKKFGLTPEEFKTMLAAQNGRCKICKEPLSAGKGGSVVDHNHTTERVRGLLCNGCNSGIGWFKEDIDRMYAAIDYLVEDVSLRNIVTQKDSGDAIRRNKAAVDVQRAPHNICLSTIGSFW